MNLPQNHPQRFDLNNEVHARPPEALIGPLRVSYIALYGGRRDEDLEPVRQLARQYGAPTPEPGTSHYTAHFGQFRLRWERHTEFARYMFIVPGVSGAMFDDPAISQVPKEWISTLPGQTIAAAHAVLVKASDQATEYDEVAARHFGSNVMIGSAVGGGAGLALTDFRIHGDGFSRFYVEDRGMTPWQAGRMVQRMLEIETYRMMALLALPVARDLAPFLRQSEQELAEITSAISQAADADEPLLLNRLTQLEALIEGRYTENHYRFSAARAYYELVQQRIDELREDRIRGLQTLKEFTERRLAPAMATCESVAERQDTLSERVARATQLLSTRVDITRSRQNQDLLASMNRRAKMQLRLQETVEGLSVAAVSYYIVGLVGYLAKGLAATGLPINSEVAMGASLPFVVVLVALGIGRLRRGKSTRKAPPAKTEG
jgi:uncharacterized membrane-anchored protein